MNGNEKIVEVLAYLKADYALSFESDRIRNPKRNDDKYEKLKESLVISYELTREIGEVKALDPDFPASYHWIRIRLFTTEIDAIFEGKEKSAFDKMISNADSVSVDCPYKGNNDCEIYLQFDNVYTETKGKP